MITYTNFRPLLLQNGAYEISFLFLKYSLVNTATPYKHPHMNGTIVDV